MPNRLAAETSPYLRQHAGNPVDWWPWCEEALALARTRATPILLSIGYSACHWCHVMAHESFEDAETARVMNELFINIKVDREERPDLDKIYQFAHQALTRRGGGWPLTVFLTPDDHLPFFAGTYFPKQPRYGMPPFVYVLQQVRGFWDNQRDDVRAQNALLYDFLRDHGRDDVPANELTDAPIRAALKQIEGSFDQRFGGHLGAPKFPHCPEMELQLDVSQGLHNPVHGLAARAESEASSDSATPNQSTARLIRGRGILPRLQDMVALTLRRMADGGIHDQLGGGFCRYSVDERWEIPHFEKMLYDNAQLLPLYARVSRAYENESDARASRAYQNENDARVSHAYQDENEARVAAGVALGIVAWLQREMTAPAGGFHSALDADSEHEEGKFYVWQRDDARALLSVEEWAVAGPYFGFDRPPNFEQHAWNPIVAQPLDRLAQQLGLAIDDARARLATTRATLFAAREKRVRPGLDDKILTAWNALMIAGIARAARTMDAAPLLGLADGALDFLYKAAWRDERLYAKAGSDARRFPAYLDDHAFLLDALLECLQSRWSERDLTWAVVLAEALLTRFQDLEHGGFFFTAHDHETLIQRPKPFVDEAVPSGNGIAARALLRLGHLLGEPRFLDAAERTLRAAYSTMQQMPQACASLLRALNDFLRPRVQAIIRYGDGDEEHAWRAALATARTDPVDAYFIAQAAGTLPGTLAAQTYAPGGVAYICRGAQCLAPIRDPTQLESIIAAASAPSGILQEQE